MALGRQPEVICGTDGERVVALLRAVRPVLQQPAAKVAAQYLGGPVKKHHLAVALDGLASHLPRGMR
ncbi:hypothetical protein DPV79_40600 [Burkholderia reimsis]|uniref:Uncharacterized protein n=1 Tax=Burkholderia reimsis TaxID=2234132 RepID=A0A365QGB6_9BURK|nr:hypothetical protein DPV79_40600 [Burkholderia reimsis]